MAKKAMQKRPDERFRAFIAQTLVPVKFASVDQAREEVADLWWHSMSGGDRYALFMAARRIYGEQL